MHRQNSWLSNDTYGFLRGICGTTLLLEEIGILALP